MRAPITSPAHHPLASVVRAIDFFTPLLQLQYIKEEYNVLGFIVTDNDNFITTPNHLLHGIPNFHVLTVATVIH